jgi:hypothetical protein
MTITIDEFLHDLTERQLLSEEEVHAVKRRTTTPLSDCAGQRSGSQRIEPGTIPPEHSTALANSGRLVLCDSVIQTKLQADENHLIFGALRIRDESPVTIHVLVPGQEMESPATARLNGSAPQSKEPPARPHGISDVGRHGEMICVCCEPVEGETLEQVVSQNGSLPLELATETLLQTAKTLKRLEEWGLSLGEISPDVLLLDNDGRIHLMGQHLERVPSSSLCQCGGDASAKRLHHSLGKLYAFLQTARTWNANPPLELALPANGPSAQALIYRSARRVFSRLMERDAGSQYPGWDELIRDLEGLLSGREIPLPIESAGRDVPAPRKDSAPMPHRESVSASSRKTTSSALWVTAGLVLLGAAVLGIIKFLAD